MWIVVMTPTGPEKARALGPFPTPERASAEGLNTFGPNTFGTSFPWRVMSLESAK